jgi:hypothetical protein
MRREAQTGYCSRHRLRLRALADEELECPLCEEEEDAEERRRAAASNVVPTSASKRSAP